MTQEEIIACNKLIFDFMGFVHSEDPTIYLWQMSGLKYNHSWNDLMPVVEKISRIEYERFEQDNGFEKYIEIETAYPRTFGMINSKTGLPMFRFNRHRCFEADTLIQAAWEAVVYFITWYNSTPLA